METMTVGELARISGVTVRTLHHYDEIGLLTPSTRSDAGYRQYDDADVERLQAILAYRELGLGLDEVAAAIDGEDDAIDVLAEARRRLTRKIDHLTAIVRSIDRAIVTHEEGTTMSAEEKLEVFGDFDPEAHEEEARLRWGDTDAYAESARRTAQYTPDDWATIQAEATAIYETFAGLLARGDAPGSSGAAEAVERHREHLSRWFYQVTPEIHAGLGRMYVADRRFTETIDRHGDGVATYMSESIAATYADRT